ncbi:hypothetical protein R6Q57_012225 [Mikania cordata]
MASFSTDSRSITLKDHLLDDLSSCSSNGFRSYPRRQCCTKVRYLIEIDLLPPMQNQFLNTRSKSNSVLYKASAALVNVFKHFHLSSGKTRKANLLPRKQSKHGFWKRTIDQNSIDEQIKQKENIKLSAATVDVKASTSYSNSSASADSYFTITSDCLTTDASSKINVGQTVVKEIDMLAIDKMNPVNGENASGLNSTPGNADGNAKEKLLSKEKDNFSPISVMDFPCETDYEEYYEVTSPFHNGSKRKAMLKDHRTNTLKPVRLEDRIALSESRTHDLLPESTSLGSQWELEENQTKKKAIALLNMFKATMPSHDLTKLAMAESVLLEFFKERLIEEDASNYTILQDAKDWINGVTRDEMFDSDDYKVAYVRDMEKEAKWLTYGEKVEKGEIILLLEYEVFTSLIKEMLLDL